MAAITEKVGDRSAALYIRLSKEDEREGLSQSVENQRSMLETFAIEHSLPVYDIYIDDGWSGTNFERPAFKRMIGDIEAGKVKLVITKDLSRLGRDYIMTGYYMERYFPEKRVRYISLLDGIDTGTESSANDITPFRAIMNDMYAKDISKKIKSVKRDKQRKGEFIGAKPAYGYKKHPAEKNKIVVDEEAALIVRRVFAMALEGISCRRIAATLNEEAVPTPASYCGWNMGSKDTGDKKWSGESVSNMLRNEIYIGNMVQGRSVRLSYKSKKCRKQGPENWIVVENTHEPLVDKETFCKAGRLLNSRKRTQSRTYDFLLKGLIFCHECGSPLTVINRPTPSGDVRLYFICRTYQRSTKAGICSCHCANERKVTEAVQAEIEKLCRLYIEGNMLVPIAEAAMKRECGGENDEIEKHELLKGIAGINNKLDKAYMDKLSGLLGEEDFERIYEKLKAERSTLELKLGVLEEKVKNISGDESRANVLVQRFLSSVYVSRDIFVSMVERIELSEDREVIIKFRFREP